MPIGKQSLSRVANGGAEPVVMHESAPAPEVKPQKAEPKKTEVKKAEVKKTVIAKPASTVASCANKTYAIGDELPEYLL